MLKLEFGRHRLKPEPHPTDSMKSKSKSKQKVHFLRQETSPLVEHMLIFWARVLV